MRFLEQDSVQRLGYLWNLMRFWSSSDVQVTLPMIVPTKPGGDGRAWLCSWFCWWFMAKQLWLMDIDLRLIMLQAWLQRLYCCTESKMSSGGSVERVVTVSSSSSRVMRCVMVCCCDCCVVCFSSLELGWASGVWKRSWWRLSIVVSPSGGADGHAWSNTLEVHDGLDYLTSIRKWGQGDGVVI